MARRTAQTPMTTEVGKRHFARLKERLRAFEAGQLPLDGLISDTEALLGLLSGEADEGLLGSLQDECNRLEYVNAALIEHKSAPSESDRAELAAAIDQIRTLLSGHG